MLTGSGNRKGAVALDANDLLQVVRSLQLQGKTSLLRTLFYLVRAFDVDIDFSQARVPGEDELAALSEVSPECARLVTAYTGLIADARRKTAGSGKDGDEPGYRQPGPEDAG